MRRAHRTTRLAHGTLIANAAPTPKAVALALIPALVLTLAFALSYVGAFHDPRPHAVPVAIVGPPAVAAQLNRLPGDPLDARQSQSRSDALSQIDDRDVYGAYDATTNRLFVASAANRGDRDRAGTDVRSHRRRAAPAGRPRHRRQAAAAQGLQRHRGVLRGDRVGVRGLHRLHAGRADWKPAQPQYAAGGCADRGARGTWRRRGDPQRGHPARELRRVLGPCGRAVRGRGVDHLRQRRRLGRHPGRGRARRGLGSSFSSS